jgi:hypothetical protein
VTFPLRIVLDINVFVRLLKAKREKQNATAVQRIFSALECGWICRHPAQIVVSYRMMDTLSAVLRRMSVPADLAEEFGSAVIDAMKAGPEELDPLLILGGTPDLTIKDEEDGGVLATALGARAHVLVTDNLTDFMPSGCETYNTSKLRFTDGSERILTVHILSRPDGLQVVIAHPIDFAMWIEESFQPTPDNVRSRFSAPSDVRVLSSKKC